MSDNSKKWGYKKIQKVAERIKDDLNTQNFVLLYAYNGTGKTRLSTEFKNLVKRKNNGSPATLYYNAFTEDLFSWENDLENDKERFLNINQDSQLVIGLRDVAIEDKIKVHFNRYANINFRIDYEQWKIVFFIDEEKEENIKISRGEENIFIWCFFLAICQLVIDDELNYSWVKYIYIDDPISSLDDNNAIMVACDLAKLLIQLENKNIKAVISSHHSLFFNVIYNELKTKKSNKYFLHCNKADNKYILTNTTDTPFFHHIATLIELKKAVDTNQIYTHHFNTLRNIMEKTSSFLGHDDFSKCISGISDEQLHARALNLMSHGNYSIFEQKTMVEDNKKLFKDIFQSFLAENKFNLPNWSK